MSQSRPASSNKNAKVVVAMSGGVDSSVAAALLKQEGYEVIGATMEIAPRNSPAGGLPGPAESARKVASVLGIPHRIVDLRDIFAEKVIAAFCQEYSRGRTPNPCVRCNRHIKFGALLEWADEQGADFFATGHYARIESNEYPDGRLLKKGIDANKDQSYFLHDLTQGQLSRALFPVGGYTKDRVKEMAREMKLPSADRPESQEICFVPNNKYAEFVKDYAPQAESPGPIVNKEGKTLGKHRGILYYTIGQRQGLGISAAEPLYVIAIDPWRNAIVVGNKEDTYGGELIATNLNWIAISPPEQPIRVKAKIRYRHPEAEAIVMPLDADRVLVKFAEPQMAITPGQSVVFYFEDTVVGGGTIEHVANLNKEMSYGYSSCCLQER